MKKASRNCNHIEIEQNHKPQKPRTVDFHRRKECNTKFRTLVENIGTSYPRSDAELCYRRLFTIYLLLYAIVALVLRRKLIIQEYSSVDEIVEACNSMADQLDVRKLLDDVHHLVVTLHDNIETLFSQSLTI